jgi:hypothetical protein
VGRKVSGTIVDLVMQWQSVDSRKACEIVLERYGAPGSGFRVPGSGLNGNGNGNGNSQKPGAKSQEPPRKQGKLHLTVDLAFEACAFGLSQRKDITEPTLAKFWLYTDARGEPQFATARFNVKKKGNATKEFVVVRREPNGWRAGLGDWGKKKLCPLYNLPKIAAALLNRQDAKDAKNGEEQKQENAQ